MLVPRVDIISAPGVSPPGVFRRGTAQALVTGRCVFRFDAATGRFRAGFACIPGETAASVRAATGFDYDARDSRRDTADPTPAELALLRGPVCDECWKPTPNSAAGSWTGKSAADGRDRSRHRRQGPRRVRRARWPA